MQQALDRRGLLALFQIDDDEAAQVQVVEEQDIARAHDTTRSGGHQASALQGDWTKFPKFLWEHMKTPFIPVRKSRCQLCT